jgi:hypothetical protein
MSTSIATVPSFAALSPDSAIAEVIEANLGGGSIRRSDLTWVKIPTGGSTRWNWSVAGNEFSEKTITGLCVVVTKTEYNLWPQTTATSGSLPFLRSLDGVTGHRVGSDAGDLDLDVIEAAKNPDGTYRWRDIPYCQWVDRKPPRAKASRVVGVLREGDPSPIFLQCSPTSLKPVDDFLRALSAQFVPHYRAIVELGLEKRKGTSADYAVLTLKHVGSVDVETGNRAKTLFTTPLTAILTGSITPVAAREAVAEEKVPF